MRCKIPSTPGKGGSTLGTKSWPEWWTWEIELSPHLLKRMVDRQFNEVDLRTMLQRARSLRRGVVEYRWIIETRHRGRVWEIIVEPDSDEKLLVIVTAYEVWDTR